MRLRVTEPEFSRVTANLGKDIAKQLVESSRRSRPRWRELFEDYRQAIDELSIAARSRKTLSHPLVQEFIIEWARNIHWRICDSRCIDAIGIEVPLDHVERLKASGGVEAFCLLLGDLGELCSASLGSNNHNREFGLIWNCPAWLKLASHDQFQSSFERQVTNVVQHEMAHFKYPTNNHRSETLAHCRGIASLLSLGEVPKSLKELHEIVGQKYPEISNNDEMKTLVLDGDQATWRLIRLWLHVFHEHFGSP